MSNEMKKIDPRLIAMFDSRAEKDRLEYFVTLSEVSKASQEALHGIPDLMVTYWTGSEAVGKTIICLSGKQSLQALVDCPYVVEVSAPTQYVAL